MIFLVDRRVVRVRAKSRSVSRQSSEFYARCGTMQSLITACLRSHLATGMPKLLRGRILVQTALAGLYGEMHGIMPHKGSYGSLLLNAPLSLPV